MLHPRIAARFRLWIKTLSIAQVASVSDNPYPIQMRYDWRSILPKVERPDHGRLTTIGVAIQATRKSSGKNGTNRLSVSLDIVDESAFTSEDPDTTITPFAFMFLR